MNAAEVIALALPSVVSGGALFVLRAVSTSRAAQGERIGRLEKWIDTENGRRAGYDEGLRAARAGKADAG